MKITIKGALISAAIISASVGGYFAGDQEVAAVKKVQNEIDSGKKRYVAYKRSQIGKSVSIAGAPPFVGAQHNPFGGYTFNASKKEIKAFESAPKIFGDEWIIVEDRIYHKPKFLTGCSREPDAPNPPLDPRPGPGPDPEPWPEFSDEVPWGVKLVRSPEALKHNTGSSVKVCITDTGTDYNHPDLKNRLIGGASFVPGATWLDDQGHGTHVAGTIGAAWNNYGIGGVSHAQILTAKVLDSNGSGYGSWIANGIAFCANNGANVISMSLGSARMYGPDPLITDAINWAVSRGVYFAIANGNDSGRVGWPAALAPTSPLIYAVAASDSRDRIASFSSRGPETSIIAPGVDVKSTKLGGGWVSFSGTSMATPHVAAALAMMIGAENVSLGVDDIGLTPDEQGKGRLNVLKTVGGL